MNIIQIVIFNEEVISYLYFLCLSLFNDIFISLKTCCHLDLFVISNNENVNIISDVLIIPTWGVRRNVVRTLSMTGSGSQYVFVKQTGYLNYEGGIECNLNLCFRCRF